MNIKRLGWFRDADFCVTIWQVTKFRDSYLRQFHQFCTYDH